MDYERQERDLRQEMAAERAQEVLSEQRRIGAFEMRLDGLDTPPTAIGADYTYRHCCTICGDVLEEFTVPVLRATLRSKLCERCIGWKVRQLNWQRWRLKNKGMR